MSVKRSVLKTYIVEFDFILYLVMRMLGLSTLTIPGILQRLVVYFIVASLLPVDVFLTKHTISINKKAVVCLIFAFIAFYLSKSNDIILSVLFIISMENVKIEKILKDIFWAFLATFLLIVCLALGGVIENLVFFRDNAGRACLGFGHPNYLGQYSMIIVLLYIYRRYAKLNIFDVAGIVLFCVTISGISDSRSAFYSCIFAVAITVFFKFFFRKAKKLSIIMWVGLIVIPVLLIISIFLSYHYKEMGAFGRLLDDAFSRRLYYQNIAVSEYGFSLFGQPLVFTSADTGVYYYIDSSYIKNLVYYGIFTTTILLALYEYALYVAAKKRNDACFIVLLVYAIYGFIQNSMLSIHYNFILLYVGFCVFNVGFSRKKKRKVSRKFVANNLNSVKQAHVKSFLL